MMAHGHRNETKSSARVARAWPFAGAMLTLVGVGCSSGTEKNDAPLAAASQAILGGQEAEDCDWPAVVSLNGCTGVLVHPQLIVYAAHCGDGVHEVRFGIDSRNPDFTVSTERCVTRSGARLGDGTDLAYCILSDAVKGVEPARILAGCELEHLQQGSGVTLVGFGADGPDGDEGPLRWGVSSIGEIGDELLLDSEGVDTCLGDSGGPLFVEFEDELGRTVRRVAGITSAGSEHDCGQGVSHYVNLAEQLSWLEASSGIDVTPCFDGEEWTPTPGCISTVGMKPRASPSRDGRVCRLAAEASPLATCGDPFNGEDEDDNPPELEISSPHETEIRPLEGDETYLEFELRAEAEDDGWGVAGVTFTLLDANGDTVFARRDEVPPYEITPFRVPEGRFTLVVEATDHAGNSTIGELAVDVDGEVYSKDGGAASCQVAPYLQPVLWWDLVLLPLTLLRRARRSGRSSGTHSCKKRRCRRI